MVLKLESDEQYIFDVIYTTRGSDLIDQKKEWISDKNERIVTSVLQHNCQNMHYNKEELHLRHYVRGINEQNREINETKRNVWFNGRETVDKETYIL